MPVDTPTSIAAARRWWDEDADTYQRAHEDLLGAARWLWGPEGWDDDDLDLLRAAPGVRLLELGCGAAAGARALRLRGVRAVGLDLSGRMLQHSSRLDEEVGASVPVVQAHAGAIPFRSCSFDLVATAYGALPFVADLDAVFSEIHRVLVPCGRAVLAVTHPIRWSFRDDPGPEGLRVDRSYFDRRPYAEVDDRGRVTYVEHHRTIGDWVAMAVTLRPGPRPIGGTGVEAGQRGRVGRLECPSR